MVNGILFNLEKEELCCLFAKMGSIKDRNGMDLKEAEDIKKEVARIQRRTIQKRSS